MVLAVKLFVLAYHWQTVLPSYRHPNAAARTSNLAVVPRLLWAVEAIEMCPTKHTTCVTDVHAMLGVHVMTQHGM